MENVDQIIYHMVKHNTKLLIIRINTIIVIVYWYVFKVISERYFFFV